jgi:hypothetical protein
LPSSSCASVTPLISAKLSSSPIRIPVIFILRSFLYDN